MNIQDIANQAGTSIATVSRAINNSGYVKEETKRKILKIVEENHFVPSAIARSLSRSETATIGVIVPDIENPFFSKMISGIEECIQDTEYELIFLTSDESCEKEHRLINMIERQRLSGLIMIPVAEDDRITRRLLLQMDKKKIPVVLIDRDLPDSNLDGVFMENTAGAYSGVEALIKEGHHKIGIIAGPTRSKPGKERLDGYKKAIRHYGLPYREEYIIKGDFKVLSGYEGAKKLLSLSEAPTAIFTSNNLMTLGALKYLNEQSYQPGKEISLLGFDEIEVLKMIGYPLSVVARDVSLQGKKAMEILLEKIKVFSENGETSKIWKPKREIIPYQLILRGSEKFL
ncbi:MAG: LacI family DNA-binding transcriptional regulator [Eubacteriales bacterium]|nr:LacI family DNA-binding transcriptional regulator [Eubacteriales bacterium]